MFTDVEGSTELLRRLGREGYAVVLEGQRALMRDGAASGGGVVVDSEGDGMLVAFSSARAALDAAVAAQQRLRLRGGGTASLAEVSFGKRIAVDERLASSLDTSSRRPSGGRSTRGKDVMVTCGASGACVTDDASQQGPANSTVPRDRG